MRNLSSLHRYAINGRGGRLWYVHARIAIGRVAEWHDIDRGRFADLVALFSPRCAVTRNLRAATHYAVSGQFYADCIRSTRQAVAHYEQTGKIRGPKTSAFALCLRGDDTAVVLDTWMFKAFGLPINTRRKAVRAACTRAIHRLADRLSVSPASAQAMVWVGFYRLSYNNGNVPLFNPTDVLPF